MEFVHLHNHSHYSLLDGLPKIDQLVKRVQELGMPAIALTDHGSLYGAIEFYQRCTAAGIKPIIGVETYVARRGMHDKEARVDDQPYHLILLAKNNVGYKNLIKLVSLSHLEGFYYKPRIDLDALEQYGEGLIALSSCLSGHIPSMLLANRMDDARALVTRYQKIFGEDFYFELQHHPTLPQQARLNEMLKTLGAEMHVPLVATNDCHYLSPGDAEAHDILLCIQTKRHIEDADRMTLMGDNFSLRPAEEMIDLFADVPEAIENTVKIAEKCNVEITLGQTLLPHFPTPDGVSAEKFLRDLCEQGLSRRYGEDVRTARSDVMERMEFELSVIETTGFASYFLIVQDFINWAKNEGIVVGPGRGSAAGSIVAYLTNITNVDPIKYELLFERFLNPERISMPDIDVDFADIRRDEVLRYVERKYGKDHVAAIITFGTMAARAAVRDVGRVLNFPYTYCDRVAKLIPMFTDLKTALAEVQELKEIYTNDVDAQRLLNSALKLEGVARHASRHACGVVIAKDPLETQVPVQYAGADDNTVITQYSLHPIEDLGLLKIDFLGLSNLTILQTAIEIVEKTRGVTIDLDAIPLDEKKTMRLLKSGKTIGVFQLESSGMRRYLKELKPTTLEDIIAMVALYRPGPMEFIPDFIAGKHGTRTVEYVHPSLEPILEKTYGVAVYQEQVMQIARDVAGFTMGEADVLRKAMGKKIAALLAEQHDKFVDGAVAKGIHKATAERIFAFIEPFARYGFNRAHAACYGLIAYQTAYFKANYAPEFMAALLTSDQHNTDRIAIEVEECRQMNLEVLPPDVNESFASFTVVKEDDGSAPKRIRFGLAAIKNVGEGIVDSIITERKKNGPFVNLEDFLSRVQTKDLNRKSMESLAKAGALDCFAERNQIIGNMELLLQYAKHNEQASLNGQTNLFGMLPVEHAPTLRLRDMPLASEQEKLTWERELLGLFLSSHPLHPYRELFSRITTSVNDCHHSKSNGRVKVGGYISSLQRIITKAGQPMIFAKVEDLSGAIEVLVFPKVLAEKPAVWVEDTIILVEGRLSNKDGTMKVLASEAWQFFPDDLPAPFRSAAASVPVVEIPIVVEPDAPPIMLTVPAQTERSVFDSLKEVLALHPGGARVYLTIAGERERRIETHFRVQYGDGLIRAVESILGENAIREHTT